MSELGKVTLTNDQLSRIKQLQSYTTMLLILENQQIPADFTITFSNITIKAMASSANPAEVIAFDVFKPKIFEALNKYKQELIDKLKKNV